MFRIFTTLMMFAVAAVAAPAGGPGPIVWWGTTEVAPDGKFVALAAGGALQTLALRVNKTLYLSGGRTALVPPIPDAMAHQRYSAIGLGRQHGLGVRVDGGIDAWGLAAAIDGTPAGRFMAVAGGSLHSVALDTNGRVVMWGGADLGPDYHAVIGVGAPAGIRFTAIAARGRYTLALGTDGRIHGWGVVTSGPGVVVPGFNAAWSSDAAGHYVAPSEPGNPYVAVAAGLDLIAALRQDGSIAVWDATGLMPPPPPGSFTHIAAGVGYALAIDGEGRLHGWGVPARASVTLVPDGTYEAVTASTARPAAIASQRNDR